DPEDVGQRIVDSVRMLVGALRATLIQLEPESETLRLLAVSGEEAFPLGPGVAGFAIRERRPLITADLLADPRITLAPDVRAHLEGLPVRAVPSVPLVAASGPGSEALTALTITPGQGVGARVLETGELFATNDYPGDPRISRECAEIPAEAGVVALAVMPLRFRGGSTGLLWVANREARAFTARDLRVLSKLADQAAIALENSRLYARAQELGVN